MTWWWPWLLGTLILAAFAGPALAAAEPRIALVIANQAYVMPGAALTNTHQDGDLIKAALEKVGFKVWLERDTPNEGRMLQALSDHQKRLIQAGPDAVGFIYYTGHGAADRPNGSNYLLPTGMPESDASVLSLYAVPLDKITSALATVGNLNIVVFDACRNVPLKRSGKDFGFKGFVPQRDQSGLLIAFATEAGNTAVDQSLYARALAEELLRPGQDAGTAFRAVARRVKEETGGRQHPQILDARTRDFVFAAGPTAPAAGSATSAVPPQGSPVSATAAPPPPQPSPQAAAEPGPPRPSRQGTTLPPSAAAGRPLVADLQPPSGTNCVLEARQVATDHAARATFLLSSSCGPVSEVVVRYLGVSQRRRVTGGRVTVDLFGGPGPVSFELASGRSAVAAAQVQRGDDVLKVALVWSGAVNLDLFALQDGARIGEASALFADNPRSLAEAQTGQSGFISSADDGALEGDHVEVYTFLKTINHRRGAVELRVDHRSRGEVATGDYCGSEAKARIDFKILRYAAGRLEQHARSFIPPAPCGSRLDERSRYQLIPKPIRFD